MDNLGFVSIIPATLAIVLAFITRDAILSLAIASAIGLMLIGGSFLEFPSFLIDIMASDSFAWVFFIEILIGILIALFQLSGVSDSFYRLSERKNLTRQKGQGIAWLAGMGVFFSDYFSPIFVGTSLRPLTDKLKISREKLAYIADSTSAPLIVIIPFTSWAIYIAGIIQGQLPDLSQDEALGVFSSSIIYNFYAIASVAFVGLISFGFIKDFGPMKRAEHRAFTTGKVIRDGAQPMSRFLGRVMTPWFLHALRRCQRCTSTPKADNLHWR